MLAREIFRHGGAAFLDRPVCCEQRDRSMSDRRTRRESATLQPMVHTKHWLHRAPGQVAGVALLTILGGTTAGTFVADGIAIHGDPTCVPDFSNNAPKGGTVRIVDT
jgi:hypothetical protein